MKLLTTYDYGDDINNKIVAMGYQITYIPETELTREMDLSIYDVIMCYDPFSHIDVARLTRLKLLMLSSTGVDQVPDCLKTKEDLMIVNNKGGYSPPIGEWIVMMLLAGFKSLKPLFNQSTQKKWKIITNVQELTDKKVVFFGTGTIAKEAVKRLKPFNINAIGINSNGKSSVHFDEVYAMSEAKSILKYADAIVVCLPHTKKTNKVIGDELFDVMKKEAVFINISRGNVVDEPALLKVLKKGKFKMCALDVVSNEPLDIANALWDFEQVFITPHNSWVSEYRNERRLCYLLENLKRFKDNQPLINLVNIKRGY